MKWLLGYFVYRRFRLIFEMLLEKITNEDAYRDDEQDIDINILSSKLANEAAELFYDTGNYEYDYGSLARVVL